MAKTETTHTVTLTAGDIGDAVREHIESRRKEYSLPRKEPLAIFIYADAKETPFEAEIVATIRPVTPR